MKARGASELISFGKSKTKMKPWETPKETPHPKSGPKSRLFAVAAFVVLQAVKLGHASEGTGGFFRYCLFDLIFLLAVAFLRIPWLTFPPRVVFGIFAVLSLLNSLLFGVVNRQGIARLAGLELSLSGRNVRPPSHAELVKEHLQGLYTVEYLPEMSAELSTDVPLCIASKADPVYLHLLTNNTRPKSIEVQAEGFSGDNQHSLVFSAADLAKVPSNRTGSLESFYLPISEPGLYRLGQVQDFSGLVKGHSKLIAIPPCPTAKWVSVDTQICMNDVFSASLIAEGVPPLTIKLSNGSVYNAGPAMPAMGVQKLQMPIRLDTSKPGHSFLGIVSVKDSLHNLNLQDSVQAIEVLAPARASLVSSAPIPLIKDSVEATIRVQGQDFPYTLAYTDPEGVENVIKVGSTEQRLRLDTNGSYQLKSLQGSLCKGRAEGTIKVFIPPPVDLQVGFKELEQKCSGPSGVYADLTFEGTPPFKLWYETISGRSKKTDYIYTDSMTESITFKPDSIGKFEYRFTKLSDKYREVSLGDRFSHTLTIHELAGASFKSGLKTYYCPGEPVHVTANVQGKGPLTLTYSVDGKKYKEDNIHGDISLNIGVLKGGSHRIVLESITDVASCTTPLNVRSPLINVREKTGIARFSGEHDIKVYKANISLPVQFKSFAGFPCEIRYKINGTTIRTTTLRKPELPIKAPGTYELIEFNDGCKGEVGSEIVTVSVYERPSLDIVDAPEALCCHAHSQVTVLAKGNPPFKIWSEIVDPHKKSTFETYDSISNRVKLPISKRDIPGEYKIYFWVTDKLYPQGDRYQGALELRQMVWSEPYCTFKNPGSRYNLCKNSTVQTGVPILLKGYAPFVVTVELKDSSSGRLAFRDVNVENAGTYMLYEPFYEGDFEVRLLKIKDSHNCTKDIVDSKRVFVSAVEAPSIVLPDTDYCVGDLVEFGVKGRGKKELEYTFNKRSHLVTSSTKSIKLLARVPGEVRFRSLKDENKCPAKLENLPTIQVHDLPTARTLRPRYSEIQMGDKVELAFEFDGTPPFTFTYIRLIGGKEVERHEVTDVREHEHSIVVQQNGDYEIVSLQDAFCYVSRD